MSFNQGKPIVSGDYVAVKIPASWEVFLGKVLGKGHFGRLSVQYFLPNGEQRKREFDKKFLNKIPNDKALLWRLQH